MYILCWKYKFLFLGKIKQIFNHKQEKPLNFRNQHMPSVEHILQNIKKEMSSLEWFSCKHIYRKLNMKDDQLSKEALQYHPGSFDIHELVDGHETVAMEFQF